MFDYFRKALREAKKEKELDRKKERLLSKDMDYQFLEEIVGKVSDNPNLVVKVTLKDHTVLEVRTKPKKQPAVGGGYNELDYMEVR